MTEQTMQTTKVQSEQQASNPAIEATPPVGALYVL